MCMLGSISNENLIELELLLTRCVYQKSRMKYAAILHIKYINLTTYNNFSAFAEFRVCGFLLLLKKGEHSHPEQ
ncbi:hypothetical protein ACSSVW_000056 [Pseudoalteromonas sp. MBR-15]